MDKYLSWTIEELYQELHRVNVEIDGADDTIRFIDPKSVLGQWWITKKKEKLIEKRNIILAEIRAKEIGKSEQ